MAKDLNVQKEANANARKSAREHKLKKEGLEKEVVALNKRLEPLLEAETTIKTQRKSIEVHEKQRQQHTDKISELELKAAQVAPLQSRLAEKQTEIDKLKPEAARVHKAEHQLAEKQIEIDELKSKAARADKAEKQLAENNKLVGQKMKRISELEPKAALADGLTTRNQRDDYNT